MMNWSRDEKGTDWNAYLLEKEKAGFCKFSDWQFMDYSHVTTQIKSKYTTKWGTRMVAVMVNDRKVDVQIFVVGFRPVKKEGHYKLYNLLHGNSRYEAENGSEEGKLLVQNLLEPFQAVGHGINYNSPLDTNDDEKPDLVKACEGRSMYDLKAMTLRWLLT